MSHNCKFCGHVLHDECWCPGCNKLDDENSFKYWQVYSSRGLTYEEFLKKWSTRG